MWEQNRFKQLLDNEILIGTQHPMTYAFSILAIEKKFGVCTAFVKIGRVYYKKDGSKKTSLDNWKDVQRLIEQTGIRFNLIAEQEKDEERIIKFTLEG